jgi:hypothetical protein
LEDFAVFLVLIAIERRLDRWPDGTRRISYPSGVVIGTGMILWGIERALDEHLWLGEAGIGSDLVQVAGVLLIVAGVVILIRSRMRWHEWLQTHHADDPSQSLATSPEVESGMAAVADPLSPDALVTRGDAGSTI